VRRLPLLALAAALSVSGRAGADEGVSLAPTDRRTVTYSDGFVIQNDWGLVRLYPRASLASTSTAPRGAAPRTCAGRMERPSSRRAW